MRRGVRVINTRGRPVAAISPPRVLRAPKAGGNLSSSRPVLPGLRTGEKRGSEGARSTRLSRICAPYVRARAHPCARRVRRRKFEARWPTEADEGSRLVRLTPWKSRRAGDIDFAATLSPGKLRCRARGRRPARSPRGRGAAVAQGGPGREKPSLEPPQEKRDAQADTEAEGRLLNESLIAPSFGAGPGGCSHRWGRRGGGYIADN